MTASLAYWPPVRGRERFLSRRFSAKKIDLDIDFELPRPALVTALLENCLNHVDGENIDVDSLWNWTVSERLQGLLAIANASTGDTTAAIAVCNNEDCREKVELELGLSGFSDENPQTKIDWISPEGKTIACRLPTGQDQLAWLSHTENRNSLDEQWLVKRLIESPAGEFQSSDSWSESIGSTLSAADPLTALTLDVDCPFCGSKLHVDIDLELLLIEGLRAQQRRLIEHIHRLAMQYHWSEDEIVSLPGWRREKYLARIAVEFE